jgi:hypothetical protein
MKDSTETFDMANVARARVARARGPYALTAAFVLTALLVSSAIAPAQNAAPQPANGPVAVPSASAAPPVAAPGQPAPQANGAFPTQPPPPGEKPGFIYAFGRWWDDTRGKIGDLSKQQNGATGAAGGAPNDAAAATQDVLKGAAEATKKAATAIVRLPTARFVEVHQRCAVAPNGAPDCRSAAANVCRSKGFTDGHPINVQSSQDCPPAVWMSGREPAPGECPEETVVLMAACD